ncbi:endoplasmic reticulum junction formation protein lunapark-B isoform X2 [Harpegnathos saltator]|nr:endoplasmic reticulum junction formation protein lunapark-B isoform X2 [Harpegnathos saltator]
MIAFIFYFCFFPASLYDQLFYITPLLFFPILILLTKKMVSWYYNRKITHNQEKLSTIIGEKKKILNEVIETETYKKAKEILLKFAPDELNMSPLSPKLTTKFPAPSETPRRPIPQIAVTPLPVSGDLRKRVLSTQNQPQNILQNQPQSTQSGASGIPTPSGGPSKQLSNTPYQISSKTISPVPYVGFRSPLPRPVLSQQRSVIDRLVDYLVGDGPSNRYALICRQCESHNGMALKEEFEYFAYRCCYCGFWNPARKQKPSAPKLDVDNSSFVATSNTSELMSCTAEEEQVKHTELETCTQSDTDSDIEVVERPGETTEATESDLKQLLDENESSEKTET